MELQMEPQLVAVIVSSLLCGCQLTGPWGTEALVEPASGSGRIV
jgi:hypothetical protein